VWLSFGNKIKVSTLSKGQLNQIQRKKIVMSYCPLLELMKPLHCSTPERKHSFICEEQEKSKRAFETQKSEFNWQLLVMTTEFYVGYIINLNSKQQGNEKSANPINDFMLHKWTFMGNVYCLHHYWSWFQGHRRWHWLQFNIFIN